MRVLEYKYFFTKSNLSLFYSRNPELELSISCVYLVNLCPGAESSLSIDSSSQPDARLLSISSLGGEERVISGHLQDYCN